MFKVESYILSFLSLTFIVKKYFSENYFHNQNSATAEISCIICYLVTTTKKLMLNISKVYNQIFIIISGEIV